MSNYKKLVFCITIVLFGSLSFAGEGKAEAAQNLRSIISKSLGVSQDSLEYLESGGMEGWSSFLFNGGEYVFISNNGDYIFLGKIKDVKKNIISDALLESRKRTKRLLRLKTIDESSFITYPANGKEKSYIIVFANSSLSYTEVFYKRIMPELNNRGVTVKYAYVDTGIEADKELAKVWNIESMAGRKKFWDILMMSLDKYGSLEMKYILDDTPKELAVVVDNELTEKALDITSKHTKVAKYVGLTGTPHIAFSNGDVSAGIAEADKLVEYMKKEGIWGE